MDSDDSHAPSKSTQVYNLLFRSPVVGTALFVLIVSLSFLWIFRGTNASVIEIDSPTYLHFAADITSGDLFIKRSPTQYPPHTLLRTPAYPALIAAARIVFQRGDASILIAHTLLALATIFTLVAVLKPYAPPLLTAGIILVAQYDMRRYHPAILTEWTSFHLVMLFFAVTVLFVRNPSAFRFFCLALLTAIAVLTRPALLTMLPVLALIAFMQRKIGLHRLLLPCAAGLLPIALWAGFNFYRLGVPSLTTFDGYNLFGVGALLGYAEPTEGDSAEFAQFIAKVNARKFPAKGDEATFIENLHINYDQDYYNENIYIVVGGIQQEDGISTFTANSYMREYGLRVIKKHPDRFLQYVLRGVQFFLVRKWVLLFAVATLCLLLLHSSRSPGVLSKLRNLFPLLSPPETAAARPERGDSPAPMLPLAQGLLTVLLLHAVHSALCITVQLYILRYYYITYFPVVVAAAVGLASFLLSYRRTVH